MANTTPAPTTQYAIASRQGHTSNWVLVHTGLNLDDALAKRDALRATKQANRDRLATRIADLDTPNQPDWMQNNLHDARRQVRYLDETDYEVVQPA